MNLKGLGPYLIGRINPCNCFAPIRGGDCHSFIFTLILGLYSVPVAISYTYRVRHNTYSSLGSCHIPVEIYRRLYGKNPELRGPMPYPKLQELEKLVYASPGVPLISFFQYPHSPHSQRLELFKKYPNLQYINIDITDEDLEHVAGNHMFKMWWNSPNSKHYHAEIGWALDGVAPDKVRQWITTCPDYINFFKINRVPYRTTDCPIQLEDYVHTINFKDIYYNPELVLNILSLATNKPITADVRDLYDTYLGEQRKFLTKFMPWIKLP